MAKFKVGDKVTLNPKSQWASNYSKTEDSSNPLNVEGKIDEISDFGDDLPIHVIWNNRNSNSYSAKDLIKVTNKKTKMTKKPVLKTKVVEKVKELERKVKPLDDFKGWSIKREKGRVIFGCGEVKISYEVLRQLLEVQKNKEQLIELLEKKRKLSIKSGHSLSASELRELADMKETPNLQVSFLEKLQKLTGDRYSPVDLLKLNRKTILGIIG